MANFNKIERYQVARFTDKSVVIYSQLAEPLPRSAKQKEAQKNLTRGEFNGYMSNKTKIKVAKILKTWVNTVINFKSLKNRPWLPKMPYFTFVTLTLSAEQKHTDQEIRRKMVFPLIQKLIRKHDVWQYFFVSEKQENGNLHIHLIVDSFIEWTALRQHWNDTQALFGYIDEFEKVHGHRNPNSTDIHKLESIRNPEAYFIAYCTKGLSTIPIKGRLWGCSDGLRKLKPYSDVITGHTMEAIQDLTQNPMFQVRNEENFTLIIGNVKDYIRLYHGHVYKAIQENWREQMKLIYTIHPSLIEVPIIEEKIPDDLNPFESAYQLILKKKLPQLKLF